MTEQWYALHVKARRGNPFMTTSKAREWLSSPPTCTQRPVNPRSGRRRPFLPGYIFVRLELDELGANALRWAEGTHVLVTFGDEPAAVPDHLINEMRRQVAELNASGGLVQRELEQGDRVRIVEGAFAGYEAIFDTRVAGKHRVQVLLSYLSQQPKRLKIRPEHIRKLDKR
jgi:transcription antitermination factor NusG